MGRDAAHRVHADRAADHALLPAAAKIGPWPVEHHGVVKGRACNFRRQLPDPRGGNATTFGHRFGGVFVADVFLGHQVKDRSMGGVARAMGGRQVGLYPLAIPWGKLAGAPVDHLRLALRVAQQQACLRRGRILVHQAGGIGVVGQVIKVDLPGLHQQVHQRQDQQPIGARRDAVPVVGHGVIARADRVDPDHLGAAPLELADAHLDGVAVMVLGHAEDQQQLGMVPVGLAKLP